MKIYLASSWKNKDLVIKICNILKSNNHLVDCFCSDIDCYGNKRFSFDFSQIKYKNFNIKTALKYEESKQAFKEDKSWLDWCDCCILILPSGKSSHLEAGYAKGMNKKLIIFNEKFVKDDFDVMYGFVDLITDNIEELLSYIS